MRLLIGLVAGVALLGAADGLPKPVPTSTIVLHVQKLPAMKWWSITTVAIPPIGTIGTTLDRHSLLVLIPQENHRWEMQRLKGWENGDPQVESLGFDGDESREPLDMVSADMTPAPDGKAVLVRILVLDMRRNVRSAVVLLVDMEKWQVVWRHVTSDPLVANSQLRFSREGRLIAAGGLSPADISKYHMPKEYEPVDLETMNPVAPGDHMAAELSFPDLAAGRVCEYSIGGRTWPPRLGRAGVGSPPNPDTDLLDDPEFTGTEAKRVAPVKSEPPVEAAEAGPTMYYAAPGRGGPVRPKARSESCAALMKAAGVDSLTELPGPLDPNRRVEALLGAQCELEDQETKSNVALFTCREGFMTEKRGFSTEGEFEDVVRLPSDAKVLSVPMKQNERYSATLASANGQDYLVLLRDKTKVEVYSVR